MNRLKQYLDTFSFRKYFYVFVGAVAVLCVFTPSFQITEEIKNQFSIQLPQLPLSPGELFVIKSNKGFLTAYSEGKKTSPLNFQKHLFAVSLYQDTALTLHGQFDLKKGHIFSHPKDYYFIKNLKVKYKNKKNKGNKLRLPSSVWKKVNKKEKMALEKIKIKNVFNKEYKFDAKFQWQHPLNSYIVSRFGTSRTLPNGRSYFHSGMDFRAPVGTNIVAAAPGLVVFNEHMTVSGNSIVLYHGHQIFTRYMHLSEFKVANGDIVNQGDVIGLSGQTGRVEGPHLHYELIWNGLSISPEQGLKVLSQL